MEGMRAKDLLAQLQDRLGPTGDGERAATLFHECCALLKQGTESETILQAHNDEDTQAAVVVWVVRWLLSNPANGKRLPLSDILACAGTNLVSFFREVPVVLARLRPYLATAAGGRAESIQQGLRLRECQETLVSLTILAKKYKDLFWRVQRTSAVPQPQVLQAGWLTFLLLKAQLLREYPDLVSCLQLLVCVLGCYVANMTLSEAEVRGLMEQNPTAIDATGRLDTLKLLTTAARADYAQVQALMPTVESQLAALLQAGQFPWLPADLLAARGPAAASDATASQLVAPSCTLHAPGMLSDRRCLSDLVLYLDGSYQAEYERAGEIDEREFLTTDFGALASPRTMLGAGPAGSAPAAGSATPVPAAAGTPGATAVGSVTPGSAQAAMLAKPPLAPAAGLRRPLALGLQSPLPIMHLGPAAPATPITQAMGSVAWLHSITRDAAPEPSPALQQLLAAAGPDAAAALASRVQEAADAVFGALQQPGAAANGGDSAAAVAAARSGQGDTSADASASGSGSDGSAAAAAWLQPAVASLQASVARERREEGLRLYYVALEAMLRAEEGRSGPAGAAALATRWAFHSCLLALSFEMVAASYRMGALCFPAIPERLGLAPFDLTKIIPAFVRALPSMPRELKRHLFTVEEKVVETLGWQASSSLYKVLEAAVGDQQQQQQDQKQAGKAAAGDDTSGGDVAVGSDQQQQQQQQQAAEAPAGEAAASARADSACPSGSGSEPQAGPSSSWSPSAAGASSAEEPSSKRRRADDGSAIPTSSEAAATAAGDDIKVQAAAQGGAAEAAAPAKPALPQALGAPPEPGGAGVAEPPAGSDPAARAVIFDFCRKVLKLAAFRLVAISEGLDFSPMERDEVLAAVHDVVAHALYCETHLFYGRHLDQLLLAALYGYCKVNRLGSITFKEIISHYRRQPHAKQEVFRTVTLRRTEPGLVTLESGDIIAFYNRVFVPSMKAHLLRRCMGGGSPNMPGARSAGNSPSPAAGGGGGGGSASGVSAASAVARHLAPGHINRSPIFTALQHAAAAQQQAAAALPAGGVIVKRAVGARSPLQTAGGNGGNGGGSASGGTAYRTLSLDSGASLGGLGLGFGGNGGMHAFGSSGALSGGADASAGGAPGLAALAAVAADGPGPVRCGSNGANGGPKPSPASGHHVARAYVPSRLGRGGGPAGSGGSGLAGKQGPAGGAGFPWGGNGGIAAYGGGAAPSPTRRSARVTSPRGPLLVGAPTPSSSTDVAQCQDQSVVAGGAHFNSSDDDAAAAAAARAVAAATAAVGSSSPYSGPRASPSSVRRVGAKRQPPSALAALAGGGGGSGAPGGAGTPSGLATLLQALESTASMEVDGTSPARTADAAAAAVGPAN